MPRLLHVFRDSPLDGPTNMARDEHLLYSESIRAAAVRVYGWSPPTISLGHFQRFEEIERLPADVRSLPIVRRQTGGGAILHDREVTYCLVVDNSMPAARKAPVALYRLVHECWRDALACAGTRSELAPDSYPMPSPRGGPFFCFQEPGRADLLIGGEKLLGSAQRRIRGRVLQHGSLLLGRRFESHPGADLGDPAAETVAELVRSFVENLARALELTPRSASWSAERLADVAQRAARFRSARWTRRW